LPGLPPLIPPIRSSCNHHQKRDSALRSDTSPQADFRQVVLRGRNLASFKFALAKSILTLAESGATSAPLEDLAVPFSQQLCAHLAGGRHTQSTSAGSQFLDTCRHFNAGTITHEELVTATTLFGFNNVIDAFHVVDSADVSTRFFHHERQQSLRGIRFTDELLGLASATSKPREPTDNHQLWSPAISKIVRTPLGSDDYFREVAG
jgi:hypothetical protein